jgi:alpha-tubulin suppressor-like RCC1 family protein
VENIVQVAAGEFHCLALTLHGNVYAWGRSDSGQLGTGSDNATKEEYYDTPQKVKFPPVLVSHDGANKEARLILKSISAGGTHSMAVSMDSDLWTWGAGGNGTGVTGHVGENDICKPRKLTTRLAKAWLHGHGEVLQASGGSQHSVVLVKP